MKNVIYGLVLSLTLVACNAQEDSSTQLTTSDGVALAVYKSETCGCCGIWTDYMAGHGYDIAIHHPADLNEVKQRFGIDPQWQSCHTAVTDDGYFFEGHIPERFVKQFLTAPPANAAGLSVPGMPVGSPGM